MAITIYGTKSRAKEVAKKKNKRARKYHYTVVRGPHGGYAVLRSGQSIF